MKKVLRSAAHLVPFLIAGGITLALLLLPRFRRHADVPSKPSERGPTIVQTVAVVRQDLAERYQNVGTATARVEARVTSQVEGMVRSVAAEIGASVKKGQTLADLDDRLLLARIAQAEASLELSRGELKRATELSEKGIADRKRLQAAVAQEQIDRAALEMMKVQLSMSRFASPLDGVVTEQLVYPGETVRNGTHLLTVADLGRMLVRATVPERVAARLAEGAAAILTIDASGGQELSAKVHRVHPTADPISHQTTVELDAGEAFPALKPGYLVRVRLTLSERPRALVLDRRAVPEIGADGTAQLFVVRGDESERAEARNVRFGLVLDDWAEILSGLEEGDQVVWRGGSLQDGAPVRVSGMSPASRGRE